MNTLAIDNNLGENVAGGFKSRRYLPIFGVNSVGRAVFSTFFPRVRLFIIRTTESSMHRHKPPGGRRIDGESGQTMAEYAVVLSVITLAIVATIGILADTTNSMMGTITSFL